MINQIILSANEDETYISFWQPVAYAYSKMFPECTVHLAFLTHREEDDPYVTELRKHGKVTLIRPNNTIPEFGQAKMARFYLAAKQGMDVCYIDDIDLFPLNKEFITKKTNARRPLTLLCVGGEVYGNNGCYPVSQMTAEGELWRQFINPLDLPFEAFVSQFSGNYEIDFREDISIVTDFSTDSYFSDERLIRRLLRHAPVPKTEMKRGYDDFMQATIDRHDWQVDREKLDNHIYMNAHGVRPYSDHKEKYEPLIEYINRNYEANS